MAKGKQNGNSEIPENEHPAEERPDIAAEMAALGKKFAEALSVAWNSQERYQLQDDIKEGLERFTAEVDEAVKNLREKEPVKKAGEGVQQVAEDVKTGKVSGEVRKGLVTALRSLSEALDRMAGSFTPVDEAPKDTPKE